jgi:hypothetical protein
MMIGRRRIEGTGEEVQELTGSARGVPFALSFS